MAGIGAIVKSAAGSLAKQQGKKIVTDKLMGRKPKALPAAGQTGASKKDTAMNMVSSMASKSPMQGSEIPASQQTINVSAQTVGDDMISGGGGSNIVKQVQDISVVVATIADSMKSNLVLKEKAKNRARKTAERDKRAAQEAETEKPDKPKKPAGGGMKFKIPKIGFLQGIFGFITKFIFGIAIMKLIEIADSPLVKGIFAAVKGAGKVIKALDSFFGISSGASALLDGLISFVDFGYKIVDGMEKIVTNIFGEEGAEKFRIFMENLKTLINSFVIFQIIKGKFAEKISLVIKNTFRFIKNFARRAIANLGRLVGPGVRKGVKGILSKGKGLLSKGAGKVGGFASKIFGKAAKFVSPALKGALPAVKGFAKRIPILGPIIVGIVSLMSGEPAAQALFKAGGAALGGALGTFIPIPFLGTLIGETIGVFVGDLLFELIMGGGIEAVGQKLKDTFMTIFKGGKAVVQFIGGGIKRFVDNVLRTDPIKIPEGGGIRSLLTRGIKSLGLYGFLENLGFAGGKDGQIDKFFNPLNLINPFKSYPLLFKSFFPPAEEESSGGGVSSNVTTSENQSSDMVMSENQPNDNQQNAVQVASETTYESGEGNAAIIPVPLTLEEAASRDSKFTYSSMFNGRRSKPLSVNDSDPTLNAYAGK